MRRNLATGGLGDLFHMAFRPSLTAEFRAIYVFIFRSSERGSRPSAGRIVLCRVIEGNGWGMA